MKKLSLGTICCLFVLLVFSVAEASAATIVKGNTRVDSAAVVTAFESGSGGKLDQASLDAGLKSLYATGLFKDVSISRSGRNVIVNVVENPLVNSVIIKGNKKIKDAEILSEISHAPRSVFSDAKLTSDVARIQNLYLRQGRKSANVTYDVVDRGQNRVDVVYSVAEGDKTKIRSIKFEGNKAFSDGRLRDVVTTSKSGVFSFLKTSDVYDEDRLSADRELLRRYYLKNGYADVQVLSSDAQYSEKDNAYDITFYIEEGEKYTFGDVNVVSNLPQVKGDSYKKYIDTKKGSKFNAEKIQTSLEDLSTEIASDGQPFADVRLRGNRDYENKKINLTYVIDAGQPTYVERIIIRGNTRTMDSVIRREFDFSEGDAFNEVLLNKAKRRLNGLGFFKQVNVSQRPGNAADKVIVVVDVEEQPTGEVSFGAGYSSSEGVVGDVSITEKNFLGKGQFVKIGAGLGENKQTYDLRFTEPYFLGYRMSAGFDLYAVETTDNDYESYESSVQGGGVHFGLPLSDNLRFSVGYTYQSREITIPEVFKDGDASNGEASRALLLSEGDRDKSSLVYSLTYSSLDNLIQPREGIYAKFSQEIAGLGGDVEFIKSDFEASTYFDLSNDLIFMLKGQAGYIKGFDDEKVNILDTYFKGASLVRGFENSGLGPRDLSTINQDALGGQIFYGATAELSFPIFFLPDELGFRGALFGDVGTLYDVGDISSAQNQITLADDKTLRASVGASLIWRSPFGPLRFDYAHVLKEESYDKKQAFRFSAGKRF